MNKQPFKVVPKKVVLKNFSKLTVKHLSLSAFFNKVAGLQAASLLKERLWPWCFIVNVVNFSGVLLLLSVR